MGFLVKLLWRQQSRLFALIIRMQLKKKAKDTLDTIPGNRLMDPRRAIQARG